MRTATVLRKVGAPPGKVLANSQSGRPAGKCHREQTADGLRAQVRVKRCGKSAPASGVTSMARQTPPGARPNVGDERPVRQSFGTDTPLVGRIDGWSPRRREALDRTPPTGRLTIAPTSKPSGARDRSAQGHHRTASVRNWSAGWAPDRCFHSATRTHHRRPNRTTDPSPHTSDRFGLCRRWLVLVQSRHSSR